MKHSLTYIFLLLLTACKHQININDTEKREHGLTYIKGTNKLVNGEVVRKFDNGKVAELHNFRNGKAIGNWYSLGYQGEVISHGFGVEANKYEPLLPNIVLEYSLLSINTEGAYCFATLYLDNPQLFEDIHLLRRLSKEIFNDYFEKHKIEDILIYDNEHEYTISKNAAANESYKIDTISSSDKKKIIIR